MDRIAFGRGGNGHVRTDKKSMVYVLECRELNIIYIDDDATNRAVLKDMLAVENIDMTEAADARLGLQMIADGEFDLIFMDLRMPNLNGLTAIRQLRAVREDKKRIPIIVVTADPSDGIRELCRNAGADDFLDKPVSMDRLFALVAYYSGKTGRLATH